MELLFMISDDFCLNAAFGMNLAHLCRKEDLTPNCQVAVGTTGCSRQQFELLIKSSEFSCN